MTNLLGVAVIGAVAFLAGAAWMEFHDAPADKIVIIDGWWSKDYAKSACTLSLPKTAEEQAGCAADPDYGYGAVAFLQG
jgi:hypothetical protein